MDKFLPIIGTIMGIVCGALITRIVEAKFGAAGVVVLLINAFTALAFIALYESTRRK